jgi:aryl-alcohol dehydrogenase-like predicted oxidoreductase
MKNGYSKISNIPFPVNRLGMGTWQMGGPTTWGGKETGWGATDFSEALATLEFAIEQGVNFFDTSDAYGRGRSEQLLGQAIRNSGQQNVAVCTKFGTREDAQGNVVLDFSLVWLQQAVEGSLKRLQREVIDVLLLHSPPDDFDFKNYDPAPFEQLVREGKIRTYGVSVKSLAGAENVIRSGFGQVVEAIYNLIDRRAEDTVLPLCRERGYAFIARCPLASGFLTDSPPKNFSLDDIRSGFPEAQNEWMYQSAATIREIVKDEPFTVSESALRFTASHPQVSVAIPGIRKKRHVRSLVRAQQNLPLSPVIISKINEALPETYPGWIRR